MKIKKREKDKKLLREKENLIYVCFVFTRGEGLYGSLLFSDVYI